MDVNLMYEIDEQLDSTEVAELKFLCRDHIPWKQLEQTHDGRDLFQRLEEQGLLGEDTLFVEELLLTIKRMDLLGSHLKTSSDAVERSLQCRGDSYSGISPFRKMLYKVSEEVTADNLNTFKFLLEWPRAKLESCTTALDVLVEMEKRDQLGQDNVELLAKLCEKFDKPLARRLWEYTEQQAAGCYNVGHIQYQDSSVCGYISRGSSYPEPNPLHQAQSPYVSEPRVSIPVSEEAQSLSLDAAPDSAPSPGESEEFYSMRSRPRGHCLIINNYDFKEARERSMQLRDRKGTDRDAEDLERVFTFLHFKVEQRKDLRTAEMVRALEEFGSMDHRQLDAFVCCVLSHGEKGSVHAVDGKLVPIRTLTQPFTSSRCPSLAGKPKVFFIQACQGQDMQRGAPIQADSEGGHYEEDAGRFLPDTIPEDADFLLGMATVEDYKSFRNIREGSIFIQELCRQLKLGCPRKEDLLTILTRVNREVSSGVYLDHKQMPEPRYTLTKKLVLPVD